jgi:hypothetical protein
VKADEAAHDQFVSALNAFLREKNVELPRIPDSRGRQAYLKLLKTQGYAENELLPVVDRARITPEMHAATIMAIIKAAESDDPAFVKAVGWIAHNVVTGRDNTNIIVHELAQALRADLAKAGIDAPDFYAGVFPVDSFNAQCCIVEGQNLVLIETGCMEMAEAVVISFMSQVSRDQKISEIARAVEGYVRTHKRADPFASSNKDINWGSGVVSVLVNAFEHFMLAHEIGHIALGHARPQRVRHFSSRPGHTIDLVEKSEFEEFQADMWAWRAMLSAARHAERTDSDVAIAIAGSSMALATALLVEGACHRLGVKLNDRHPPASERLYMLQVAYELFGVREEAGVAYSFTNLVTEVLEENFPGTEAPPILDRDLNRKLMTVLDSLNINYSHAPYITGFA